MNLAQRFRQPADLGASVPVFPLRGVVLLPRASLPFNIFEPRYLKMIEDVLAGGRLVGLVQPEVLSGDEESPAEGHLPLRGIGCIGRLTGYQELDDGRYLVSLTGIARCTYGREIEKNLPYRTFAIDCTKFADDFTPGLGEAEVDREALLRTLKSYLEARKLKADWAAIQRSGNEQLINSLSVVSPFGPQEKQALLEAPNLKARAQILVALAEMDLASSAGSSGSTLQ